MTTTAIILAAVGLGIFLVEWLTEPVEPTPPYRLVLDTGRDEIRLLRNKAAKINGDGWCALFEDLLSGQPKTEVSAEHPADMMDRHRLWLAMLQKHGRFPSQGES